MALSRFASVRCIWLMLLDILFACGVCAEIKPIVICKLRNERLLRQNLKSKIGWGINSRCKLGRSPSLAIRIDMF